MGVCGSRTLQLITDSELKDIEPACRSRLTQVAKEEMQFLELIYRELARKMELT